MPKPTKGLANVAKGRVKAKPSRIKAPKSRTSRPSAPPVRTPPRRAQADVAQADAGLFLPLGEGERADALRTLLEDERLRGLAKVGRYRVIAVEALVLKPPEPLAGRRLARVIVYDYAGDRSIDACVDLDHGAVCHVSSSQAQPMLSIAEEAEARAIALKDERVSRGIALGDAPLVTFHYWGRRPMDLAYRRRSAAVVFGTPDSPPTLVAVVDLVDETVIEVVPAEQW